MPPEKVVVPAPVIWRLVVVALVKAVVEASKTPVGIFKPFCMVEEAVVIKPPLEVRAKSVVEAES